MIKLDIPYTFSLGTKCYLLYCTVILKVVFDRFYMFSHNAVTNKFILTRNELI